MAQTDDGVKLAVGLVVVSLVAVYTIPIAIEEWYSVNFTDVPENIVTLWELVPLFIVLALVLFVVGWALKSSGFLE